MSELDKLRLEQIRLLQDQHKRDALIKQLAETDPIGDIVMNIISKPELTYSQKYYRRNKDYYRRKRIEYYTKNLKPKPPKTLTERQIIQRKCYQKYKDKNRITNRQNYYLKQNKPIPAKTRPYTKYQQNAIDLLN